jgi:hypothetical protein
MKGKTRRAFILQTNFLLCANNRTEAKLWRSMPCDASSLENRYRCLLYSHNDENITVVRKLYWKIFIFKLPRVDTMYKVKRLRSGNIITASRDKDLRECLF